MTTDPSLRCPVCDSAGTYWIFSTIEGDVWDCGSCGHQWTVDVAEMITQRRGNGVGGITPGKSVDLGTETLKGSLALTWQPTAH